MLTHEQQEVVDAVCSSNANSKIIAVNAIAGSGKTSTGDAIIRAYKPKNGFYTAFNKAIVKDSSKRFGKLLDCRTIHSLAYQYIRPSKNIEDLNYSTIVERITYDQKKIVLEALDDFFRSDSANIEEYAAKAINEEYLQHLMIQYANYMLEGTIPPTFNYMLKCLHLMLLNKEITIDYDLLILDECQDTTAVALEIFKLINANAKVILGDRFQNIYSFMNTVNAFELLDDLHLLRLTKSFRCNPDIAAIVEAYGRKYLEEDFQYKGNEDIQKSTTFNVAFLTRTNAALIERMVDLLNKNQTFTLTRNVNEIFSLPIAMLNAANGRPVFDKKYKYLQDEFELYQQLQAPSPFKSYYDYITYAIEDTVIENTCRMLMNFASKNINLYALKEEVAKLQPNKDIVLTTAHAFKGLEMNSIYIEDDLNRSVNKAIASLNNQISFANEPLSLEEKREYLTIDEKENLNTYYVALSRARTDLANVAYM